MHYAITFFVTLLVGFSGGALAAAIVFDYERKKTLELQDKYEEMIRRMEDERRGD